MLAAELRPGLLTRAHLVADRPVATLLSGGDAIGVAGIGRAGSGVLDSARHANS